MRTHVLAAVLAAAALTTQAPAAQAGEPEHQCSYDALSHDAVTGQTFEGVVWGYVVHAGGGPVQIRCYVTVSGVEQDSTDLPVFVDGVGLAFGRLTFAADPTERVEVCSEVTTPHGSFDHCYGATNSGPFPPQEWFDLVDDAIAATDLCTWTRLIGGRGFNVLGQVVVDADGDVYLAGKRSWDCT